MMAYETDRAKTLKEEKSDAKQIFNTTFQSATLEEIKQRLTVTSAVSGKSVSACFGRGIQVAGSTDLCGWSTH
ncbi:hypothetical protein GCM10010965_16220 [Caldalkalibacillus thermarum]|nr:hypothetical protein GCM10010965_16220 [Caldalkalibacillus thermarum]